MRKSINAIYRWFLSNVRDGDFMRRIFTIVVIFLILAMAMPSTHAKPAEPTNTGAVFGGQHSLIDNLTTDATPIDELPAIAEDFTATWCDNCLQAEAVLDDLELEGLVQKYEFHRSPDHEDPLGNDFASAYLTLRYQVSVPPLVAFNGTTKKAGTLPDSDSLESDYRSMIATPLGLGNALSSFAWTPKADCNCEIPDGFGIINWNLDLDMSLYPNMILNVNAWFVEDTAQFSDGGNGAGSYHDIVRNITDLGTELSGSATIEIPSAYDGNDLEVHLVYVMSIPEAPEEVSSDENENAIPGFGVLIALGAILCAAIFSRPN